MKDTHLQVERRLRAILAQKTGEERLILGCSMFSFSKELVQCSIRQQNPSITPSALRRELFLRFYGRDFPPDKLDKILKSIHP